MEVERTPALPASLQWAISFLVCLCSVFVLNAMAALVGVGVKSFSLPCYMLIGLIIYYIFARRDQRCCPMSRLLIQYIVIILCTIVIAFLVSLVWEYSYWGRGFYTDAIVALADGWNPIYDGSGKVGELVYRSSKAVWYLNASLYAFFGHYEMAKAHTLLFAIPTYLLAKVCFERLAGESSKWVRTAAFLAVLNPVALVQVFTFYNDAVLAYCIQCFLLLGYYILNEGYLHGDLLFVQALLWVFILHCQDGGLRAAFILGCGWMFVVMFLFSRKALKWLSLRAAMVVFLGLIIVGFSPFVKNTIETGTPFAPYIGRHAVDLASSRLPDALSGKPGFVQMLDSVLMSPDASVVDQSLFLQQISALFSTSYASPDVALRGFGFLGGLLIFAATICLVVGIPFYRQVEPEENLEENMEDFEEREGLFTEEDEDEVEIIDYIHPRVAIVWFLSMLALCVLASPTMWWARSIAVAWFFIPLAILGLHIQSISLAKRLATALTGLALLNILLFGAVAIPHDINYGRSIQQYWTRMNAADLPTDEDAVVYNQYITDFQSWSEMKQRGESTVQNHSIWHHLTGR